MKAARCGDCDHINRDRYREEAAEGKSGLQIHRVAPREAAPDRLPAHGHNRCGRWRDRFSPRPDRSCRLTRIAQDPVHCSAFKDKVTLCHSCPKLSEIAEIRQPHARPGAGNHHQLRVLQKRDTLQASTHLHPFAQLTQNHIGDQFVAAV